MPDDERTNESDRSLIRGHIDQYGCHLVMIEAGEYLPGFVYSIGLYERFNHPEIICFGLKTNVMATIINDICHEIKDGKNFDVEINYTSILKDYDVCFLKIAPNYYSHYLGFGGWYYGNCDFPAIQLVWPDKQHNFPWQENFNKDWKFKQPLLDRNVDFMFYEERTLGVFTTRQAFKGESILYVYHNKDGDWEFHTSSEPNIEDGILVCLDQITATDPSINDVYSLQYGWCAWREYKGSDWQFEESEEDE